MHPAETNPFFHRGPIRRREYFFGRTREVEQLLGLVRNDQNVALVGQRRIGKTSLLFHVIDPDLFKAHGLGRGEHLFIYLDATELGHLRPDEVLGLLLRHVVHATTDAAPPVDLGPPPPEEVSYREFRQAIVRGTEAGLKLIVLLDEFESLARNPHLGPRFFSGLRALSSQFELCFVTASRQSLIGLTYANAETLSSPFFNTFATLRLGLLSHLEARDLVETLAARAGLTLPPPMVDRIVELAGPHPLLLQIAAFYAVELWGDRGWRAEGDTEWRRHFLGEAEAHYAYYWQQLHDGERYALAALPLVQGDEAQKETLHRLERACLIRPTDQGVAYLSPAFEGFVRRRPAPNVLQLGPFLLDLSRQAALCRGVPLRVTTTEFKALGHLIRRAGHVVTPEELEQVLWEDEYIEDPDRVRGVIKGLRKALGDDAGYLATKWGVGYTFQVSA
jgi:hypothetical protein